MKRWVMILLVAMAIPVLVQSAQGAEIKELLSGQMFPLTLRLKDLDEQWRQVSIGGQFDMIEFMKLVANRGVLTTGTYYTKGEVVRAAGQTLMVAYRVETKPLAQGMEQRPMPFSLEKLTPETGLAICFLNVRQIASLNEVRPFDLQREIAESGASQEVFAEERDRAVAATSLSNLKSLALAALMYANEHGDALPPMKTPGEFKAAVLAYAKVTAVFDEPQTGRSYVPNAALSGKNLAKIDDPAQTILVYEATARRDGTRLASFVDGHAKRLTPEEWERLKKISVIK